jgi:glycosyltransferase involved in cell wall biosynthesis
MMERPTTSVIVPVFNGAAFIREALDSVVSQLEEVDEVLVVDDRSTDDTPKLLRGYGSRIAILEGTGQGPSAARNLGLAAASGEFIAFLDHDDLWPSGRHRELLAALRAEPSADAAMGRLRIRLEQNAHPSPYVRLDGRYEPGILMSCLYRRSLIDRTGPFDVSLRFGEDTDFYLRQLEIGMKVIRCDVESLIYRRHATNSTNAAPPKSEALLKILAAKIARRRAIERGTGSNGS